MLAAPEGVVEEAVAGTGAGAQEISEMGTYRIDDRMTAARSEKRMIEHSKLNGALLLH